MPYVWWPCAGCIATAYLLGVWLQRRARSLANPSFGACEEAWKRGRDAAGLVRSRAKRVAELDLMRLVEIEFYVQTARELALEVARVYHPRARDPVGSLTLPEVLAVIELAA